MRFGLTTALPRDGVCAREFAQRVEATGIDVLTFADHLAPTVSPFSGAAAAAAVTSRLRVGTLVLNNDFRHPVETARESAGVAIVSGGRFELGIGAGHMKSEYDAAGLRFDGGAVRVSRLAESVAVIKGLLAGEAVDFDGDHYHVHAAAGEIVAVPSRPVPILVGGNGTRVLRLAGRGSPTSSGSPESRTTGTPPECGSATSTVQAWPTGSPSCGMRRGSVLHTSNSTR